MHALTTAPRLPQQVALEQYLEGEACAAKLLPMAGLLNAQFADRGRSLRVACLNNAAIVRLKMMDWGAAAALCTRALDLALDLVPPDAISRAKALFRRALALTKLGDAPLALRDLREAHRLAPRDREVLGALRLVEFGAEMESRRGPEADEIGSRRGEADEIGSRRGEADEIGSRRGETVEMHSAFTALANPMAASDAGGLGAVSGAGGLGAVSGTRGLGAVSGAGGLAQWADAAPMAATLTAAPSAAAAAPSAAAAAVAAAPSAAPSAAVAAAAATMLKTAPIPTAAGLPVHDVPKTARRTIKFAWARRWLEARLVGLACHAGHGVKDRRPR